MSMQAKKRFVVFGILTGMVTACLGLETQHSNHLGWALLFSGAAFSAIGCLYLGSQRLRNEGDRQDGERSLWLPMTGVLLICWITPLEYIFLPPVLSRSDHAQDIGLILFAGGLAFYLLWLRSAAPRSRLSQGAAFRRRHSFDAVGQIILCPLSASLLLFALALGIGYSSLLGLGIIVTLVLPGLINWIYRMGQGTLSVR